MSKLFIDVTGRQGLAPKFNGDMNDTTGRPQLRYLGKAGQSAQGIFNPLRNYGYMSPSTDSFVSITESDGGADFTTVMRASIYDSNSQDYFLGDKEGTLWYGDDATDLVLSKAVKCPGTTPSITDLEIYQVNGVRKLFYCYINSTGSDIGISNMPFGSNDNTWMSATVSGAFASTATDNFMIVADNGFAYWITVNSVHKIDGTTAGGANGTVTPNVLVFPPDFNLYDGLDWKGNIWLAIETSATIGVASTAAYNERIVGVYVWDRQSTQVRMQDFIPMSGVKEIRKIFISPSGRIRVIVISSERFVQIREYNGTTFEVVAELGMIAYPQYRDSLTRIGNMSVWFAADRYFYGYGSLIPGESEELYMLGSTTSILDVSTVGCVLLLDANSSTTTTRSGLIWSGVTSLSAVLNRVWYPFGQGTINSVAMQGNQGDVYTLVSQFPTLSKVNYIRVYHAPQSTSGTTAQGTLKYYLNQSTTLTGSVSVTRNDIARGYVYQVVGKTGVFAIQFEIEFATGITLGTNDWLPRMIEVDYEDTTKLK